MKNIPVKKNERGAVLIIALIMLLILTVLGVAVMESSVIEERMAGNAIDRNRAFQAAETALRMGEQQIANLVQQPIAVNGPSNASPSVLGSVIVGSPSWWSAGAVNDAWWLANGRDSALGWAAANTVRNDPRYVIEEYDTVCDGAVTPTLSECKIVYRVTAFAWGARNSTVILQSLYARRY